MKTNLTQIIGYLAIAAILISLFFIGTKITGLVVTANETALVNVTISGAGALNFTTDVLDFGAGAVNVGQLGATINSEGSQGEGTWAAQNGQLVLENIGNENVSLTLSTNKSVDSFIGGSSPTFKAKVSDKDAGACTGTQTFSSYAEINTTLQTACAVFGYAAALDEINIDFQLYIPNDAAGEKTVKIIAIGTY
jgi:hypothetical protein